MLEKLEQKISAREEIINLVQRVAELSEKVRANAQEKLSCVVLPYKDEETKMEVSIPRRAYPPLFDELRGNLEAIHFNLVTISTLLSQAEL